MFRDRHKSSTGKDKPSSVPSLANVKAEDHAKSNKTGVSLSLITYDPNLPRSTIQEIPVTNTNKTMSTSARNKIQKLLKKSVITPGFEKRDGAPPMRQSTKERRELKQIRKNLFSGSAWFDMPAPEMTKELKNDLQVIKMRNALDKRRFYKKSDWRKLPKYFQVGTVIEGAGEYYSARVPKKQRRKTIVEEVLAEQRQRQQKQQ